MADRVIPKWAVPIEFSGTGFRTVEQGSLDNVAGCVYAIVATKIGSRMEDPDFGVDAPDFDLLPLELEDWAAQIARLEPRAEVETEQEIEDLTDRISIPVKRAA